MKICNFKIVKPARLQKGDTIGIVAPAWSFDSEAFKKGVDKLKKLDFKIEYDRSIFDEHWSMAGHDKERAEQINRMFADKEVKAIFCAAAGYGSIRTIPYLNKTVIKNNPKIFLGYSDITILLAYLYKTANMVVFHGPVVAEEIHERMNHITLDYLLHVITQVYPIGQLQFPNLKPLKPGRATGILVGGNMSLIVNAIGTPYEINTLNKILYLEDIGEDLEVIDSYLMQLKLAGKLKKVKGIIFGRMIGCVGRTGEKHTMRDVLIDMLHDINVPIIYGFPSGHRKPGDIDITLPFGIHVTLDANDPKLIINESAVK